MTAGPASGGGAGRFGALDPKLLSDPLAFIHAEHLRHRELCRAAEELADSAAYDAALGMEVAAFLEGELAVHIADEEQNLFPLLRRRSQRGDDIEKALSLLSGEHAADSLLRGRIVEGLTKAAGRMDAALGLPVKNALRTFADRERRHFTMENAIVLPFAAKRLTRSDLAGLSRRMAARRGVDPRRSSE
ncbi:MAG: hemerythrin domain-containing protein [Hyphomicrobiaceae bacterium]|nr:hemerythrin domain-containing protein [Hyphomicrobiaceae bacterium]